jgi:hypothetical protein
MCGIRFCVARSHLVVLTNVEDILFTFAPGIRKRFQSSPNALEICRFATPKPGRGFPARGRRDRAGSLQVIAAER